MTKKNKEEKIRRYQGRITRGKVEVLEDEIRGLIMSSSSI